MAPQEITSMATRFHSHRHHNHKNPPKEMKAHAEEALPDLTDSDHRQIYNLKGEGEGKGKRSRQQKEAAYGEKLPLLSTSRLTQDWLSEAKRIVAGGPTSRHASQAKDLTPPALQLDYRDALSRSARRNRFTEGISDEILQRSLARHNRRRSDFHFAADSSSPARTQHTFYPSYQPSFPIGRLSISRFLEKTSLSLPPSPLRPEDVSHQPHPLSPPRNLLKSFSRKTDSSSICSIDNESTPRRFLSRGRKLAVEDVNEINAFLRRQRAVIDLASDGEVSVKAKFVLSSYTPDTSSMVAAICYAWLLENMRKRDVSCIKDEVVVPVINMRRARMWEHKQAAWLLHHIGIDASALIFSDELDLKGLLMGKQLSLLIVGQDVLNTNGEDGSLCTILTDKYCEDASDLLHAPHIRRLLLAGILLDSQNLSCVAKPSTIRDSEAVKLLLVGSSPDYRDFFFQQVIKEHGEESFIESMKQHYGKLSIRMKQKHPTTPTVGRAALQQTQALPLAPFRAIEKSSRVKKKFTLGRFFNFFS